MYLSNAWVFERLFFLKKFLIRIPEITMVIGCESLFMYILAIHAKSPFNLKITRQIDLVLPFLAYDCCDLTIFPSEIGNGK